MIRLGLGSRNKKGLGTRIFPVRFLASKLGPNQNRTETEYLEEFEETPKFLEKTEFLGLGLRNKKGLGFRISSVRFEDLELGPNRNRTETEDHTDFEAKKPNE